MDNIKDNKDSPERQNTELVSQRNTDPISFFLKNEAFVFVYKKTEKLATALYMVTNLFSDNEPMKWALRKKVGDLLSFMVGYKDIRTAEYSDFSHTTKGRVLEIVSLLEVSFRSGLVSSMNFSILKQEFSALLVTLDDMAKVDQSGSGHENIPKAFFDVPPMHQIEKKEVDLNIKNDVDLQPKKIIQPDLQIQPTFKRTNRQTIILNLLKKKKEATVKDISEVIKGCSEKTIQRELISLIDTGLLTKTGERRWTKYSLKTS